MRSRAYRRHQAQRAYSRAHRLIVGVLGHRADPHDAFAPSQEDVDRLVRMYSVDRVVGRPSWHYGPDRAELRARISAREQLRSL